MPRLRRSELFAEPLRALLGLARRMLELVIRLLARG